MTTIEVKCDLELPEHIILAVQEEWTYPPLTFDLPNGDTATVHLVIPKETVEELYKEHGGDYSNWWINPRVKRVQVRLIVEGVSDAECAALRCEADAETFQSAGEEFQKVPELGERVVGEICSAVNRVLKHIRISSGQYWLSSIDPPSDPANFCHENRCEWHDSDGEWRRFMPAPSSIGVHMWMGIADQYLELDEWKSIQSAIQAGESPSDFHALLIDARKRFEDEEVDIALIQLNSALELVTEQYIETSLVGQVPSESLKVILKQSYARNLSNWVLPLSRQDELNLVEGGEWESIQRIRHLRNKAAHPGVSEELSSVDYSEFIRLLRDAQQAIEKMTGVSAIKLPRYKRGFGISAGSGS